MQFILPENWKEAVLKATAKHTLTEKYILTEATIQDVARRFISEVVADLTTFKGKIDAITAALKPDSKSSAITAAYEAYLEAEELVENAERMADLDDASANELRTELGNYTLKVKDLITALDAGPHASDPAYTAGKSNINTEITNITTKTTAPWTTTSADKTAAMTAFNNIKTAIATFKATNLIGGTISTDKINSLKSESQSIRELVDKLLKDYQFVNVDIFEATDINELVDKIKKVRTNIQSINK